MAINIDANANVNINVSGQEVIDKLEKEVARLNNRLIETQDELSDAMYEADMLRDRLSELEGKDVGILNASLEQFQETARRGTTEIQRMLSAFNVKDAIGNTEFVRDRLLEVEGGVKTVGQALSEIKNEFRPLFEESYNKSGGLLDTQTIQTFLASLDTVLEKVNEISSQVNLMMKDGVPTSGSTGGAYGTTNIIDQIRTSVEGMSEEARAAYQPLTQLVEKVSEFANLDSTRIIGVANAFKGLSGVGDGGYSDKKIANITKLLNTLENADSSKLSALQFNPKGFNDLHVSKASLRNLAEYLPQIQKVNAAKLKELSDVNLTNFNNVKVSKASMEAIAQLNDALKELNNTKVAVANGTTSIDVAPIKKEAAEVVSAFDQIENRIKSIGTGQGSLSTMRDAFKSIKPVLENNTELTAQFVEAINQIYGERYFVELTKGISKFSKGIITATQLTKSFENTIKMQDTAIIPKPIEIDDTAFKKLKAIQTILRKAQSFESGEVTSYSKSGVPTGWEITSERLFSVIKQEASDAQLKVLGLNRELMSLNDVRQILDSIAKDTHDGLRYNNDPNWVVTGMDYVTTNNNIIRRAIEDQKELTQRTKENDASLVELRNTLQNTFGDLPNKNGSLAVSLDQLKQIENEAPAATEYIYEIEKGLNKSLYNNRSATETPISQIKTEAEEAANSEEHLMTVTQELTETVSDGIGGNGFVSNLDDIQQAVNGIVDSIKTLNSELQKIKQVDTPTSRGIRGGSSGNQSVLSIAQEEELAYAEWNKIQKEQQRVHDQTIISWNKVGDAAEKEEQRIERATQREIESHYKAEQASEEAAFKELEARRAAEEKKQSEIARSLADFETKLKKEKADVLAATQKELAAYAQYEKSREAKIEKENEKLFQSHVKVSSQRRELEEQRAHEENEAYQSGLRKAEQVVAKEVELERQKYQQELDALGEYERAREAKIEKENEKLFQSHVKTFAQRRELEEQRAHEENEAYQSGLRKAEQAVAKEVELEKQKYQQELDALEKYERVREAKIEKENEKLFQSHVRASQDANLQAKWQSQGITESNIKSLFGKAKNNKDLFEGIEGGFEGLTERYREVLALHEKYKDKLHDENDPVVKNIENRTKALKEEIEAVLDDAAAKKKTDKAEKDKQSLLGKSAETVSRLRKEYAQWTAAAKGSTSVDYHKLKDFADSIDDLIGQLSRDEISPEEFKRKFDAFTSGARQSEAAIKSVGKNTQSLADRVKGLTTKFGAWLSVSQIVMAAVRAVKKMISTAQEIDAAMTQLKIVTNATNNEMKEFSNTAITLAKDLGKSVTELTKSIETFSRLGYSLKDASELAKYATIMSNVAGVSADEATTGLTSIVKGYNLDVSEAEHVADILVDVGQKYAVSASEMMDAFEKSGAALHATNTTLEKSAGLIASANASVQDSSVVGREMPSFTVM